MNQLIKIYVNIVFFILLNPFLRFLQLPVGEMDPLGLLLTLPLTTYILIAGKLKKKFLCIYILIFIVLIYSLCEIIISNHFVIFHFLTLYFIISGFYFS